MRASQCAPSPARIGSGSETIIRVVTKSTPRNGASQMIARLRPISVQLVTKATAGPTPAPMASSAPASG